MPPTAMDDASPSDGASPSAPPLIDQIRAIAAAPPGAASFAIVRETGEIQVRYGAALAQGIELRAPFPEVRGGLGGAYRGSNRPTLAVKRPLAIYLREESASDRRYKAAGINREVQTGDGAFDAEVYINALHDEDAEVRAVLAHEEARAAAVTLLREKPAVFVLDDADGSVVAHFVVAHGGDKDADRGRRIIDAFDQLLGALPRLESLGKDGKIVRGWMIMLAWAAVLTPGAVLFFTMRPPECRPAADDIFLNCSGGPRCCEPVAAGLAGGLALAIAVGLVLWKVVRGKSNSSTKQKVWMILSTGLCLEIGVLLGRLLW